jgi:hypothetical protein
VLLDLLLRNAGAQQRADPVDELGRRGLLPELALLTEPVELEQHLVEELRVEVLVVHVHDLPHERRRRELDEVKDAAAQECVGQLLLVVRRDEHDRTLARDDLVAGLDDREAHLVELAQKIVRKLDVRLVDLVDEDDLPLLGRERLPERSILDVAPDVGDVTVAEAAVVQTLHGVVDVETVDRLARRLDVPLDERHPETLGDVPCEHRLPRAGLALDQERALKRDRAVDRVHQGTGCDVPGGTAKAIESVLLRHGGPFSVKGWIATTGRTVGQMREIS